MRIGILSQWYDPETGGPALPGVLARGLRDRGHEVQVVTGFPNYPLGRLYDGYTMHRRTDEVVDDVSIRRVALYPAHGSSPWRRMANFGSFAASASISGISALRRVDAIWVNNAPTTISAAAGLSKLLYGRPHVLHVMDLWPDSVVATGFARPGRSFDLFMRGLDAWCDQTYRWASSVAYIAPGVGELLRERGVPEDKLHYVPVWADETVFFPSQDDSLRLELGLGDAVVLLYAGALGPVQGIDTLVEACARVQDLEGFHCIVAGSGTNELALRRRTAELGLRNLTFLGHKPKPEMTRVMAAGDVHLISLRSDPLSSITLPSKVQATLASGRASIVAIDGDAARVARESGAGIPVTPGSVEELEAAIRSSHGMGRAELAALGRLGRVYYDREFAVDIGVCRVSGMLEAAARV